MGTHKHSHTLTLNKYSLYCQSKYKQNHYLYQAPYHQILADYQGCTEDMFLPSPWHQEYTEPKVKRNMHKTKIILGVQ